MDSRSQELQGLHGLLLRARENADRNGSLRRRALEKLLNLAHSSLPDYKVVAAQSIPSFITDFPALEEQAINAVYDLCEDQSMQVRIEGYKSITEISRADSKLLKRNADVLLQLLQSDEPEEVAVVKKALIEHVQMGPAVTIGILGDTLSPASDECDDEEKQIRERLRSLVLEFFLRDGRDAIMKAATAGSPAETAVLENVQILVPHLDSIQIQHLMKGLVLDLPGFRSPSTRGGPLLATLLQRVSVEKKTAQGRPSLSTSQPYLQIAQDLVLKRSCHPIDLLRYYCTFLTDTTLFQQISVTEKLWVLFNLADLLIFCHQYYRVDQSVQEIQWKVVDMTPALLDILTGMLADKKRGKSCIVLLRNIRLRKQTQPTWETPATLLNALIKLRSLAAELVPGENKRELQTLLMHLIPANNAPKPNPPRPASATPVPPLAQNVLRRSNSTTQITPHPNPSTKQPATNAPPPTKKRKTTDEVVPKLSLLNRLQSSTAEPPRVSSIPQPQGLSIRGAASLVSTNNGASSPQNALAKGGGHSLLARLQGVDDPSASSEPEPRQQHKRRRK